MNNTKTFLCLLSALLFFCSSVSFACYGQFLSNTNQVTLPKVKLIKQWAEVGINIGESGFYSADLDGTGKKEVIYGSSSNRSSQNSQIAILKEVHRDESNSPDKYEIVKQFHLPNKAEFIKIYGFYDLVSDNHFLVVISVMNEVHVFNLTAQRYITKLSNLTADKIEFADIDNDNIIEMLLVSEQVLTSINTLTWQVEKDYQISNEIFLKDKKWLTFQFGHFLDKNSVDIAFTNGNVYREKSGDFEHIWTIKKSASYDFSLDVNNDGLDELVGKKCTLDVLNRAYVIPKGKSLENSNCNKKRLSPESAIDPKTGHLIRFYKDPDLIDPSSGKVIGTDTVTWQEELYASPYSEPYSTAHTPRYSLNNYFIDDIDNDGLLETVVTTSSSGIAVNNLEIIGTNWPGMSWVLWDNGLRNEKVYTLGALNDPDDIELLETSHTKYIQRTIPYSHWIEYSSSVLARFNIETLSTTWESKRKPEAQAIADISGDGQNSLISTYFELPYETSVWVQGVGEIYRLQKIESELSHSDIDFDGKSEILLLLSNYKIVVLRATTSDSVLYSIDIDSSISGDLKDFHSLDFDNDGIQEVLLRDENSLFVYSLEANNVDKYDFTDFGNYSSAIINGQVKLLSTNAQGELVAFNQNIESSIITKICDETATHLSVNNNQAYYICGNKLGVLSLQSNEVIYQQMLNDSPSKVQMLHTNALSYLLTFTENKRALYKIDLNAEETVSLEDLSLTTASNNAVEGKVVNEAGLATQGFYISSSPQHGSLRFIDRLAGTFSYTPFEGFSGEDEFKISSINQQGKSAQASVAVSVVNTPPVINNQSFTTHWNTKLTGLINAEDIDHNLLEFSILSQPSTGVVTFINSNSGQFEYTPVVTNLEPVRFIVMVSDGYSHSEATITVAHSNNQPTVENLSTVVTNNEAVDIQLLAGDIDGDKLIYKLLDSPIKSDTKLDENTGILSYTPSEIGNYEVDISFRVSDGINYSKIAIAKVAMQARVESTEKNKTSGGVMFSLLGVILLLLLQRFRNTNQQIIERM